MNSPHFNLENFTSVLFSTTKVESQEDKELREKTFIWKNSLLFSIEQERLSLLRTLMRNGFDVKDLNFTKLRRAIEDKLFYLWVNFFKLGSDHIESNVTFSTIEDVAEFAALDFLKELDVYLRAEGISADEKKAAISEAKTKLNGILISIKTNLNNEQKRYTKMLKQVENAGVDLQKGKITREFYDKLLDSEKKLKESTLKWSSLYKNTESKIISQNDKLSKAWEFIDKVAKEKKEAERRTALIETKNVKEDVVSETEAKRLRVAKELKRTESKPVTPIDNANVKRESARVGEITRRTRLEQKIRNRRLKEKDKTKESSVNFLEETDFGRVYLQQRVNYIGNVYVGTEREEMEQLVNTLQRREEFEKGNVSQPLTEYFERGVRYRNKGLVDRLGRDIKTQDPQTIDIRGQKVSISGKRLDPQPQENTLNDAERTLLGELRTLFGNNDNKVRRIAETEISAAYNLGRIHAMYNRGETLVRWINDRENTLSGKVCQICLSIAMGRTTKPQVKDLIPPDLSGVYTLDEVLTERQLAIPVHPYCSCYVRPLTDAEKSRIGAIPEGLGEIVTSAIATVGAAGTSTINVQEDEKRANQWWGSSFVKNAALIGAGVVTMSAALFWMRKSLGNRGAAELLKRKGAQMAKDIDNLRLGPKQKQILRQGDLPSGTDVPSDAPITQKSVDESLVIKEGIEEQGQPLPELLSRLPRLEEPERVLVENAYTRQATYGVAAEIGVVQLGDVKNASTGDLSLVKDQLQGQINLVESSIKQVQLDKFNASEEVQQSLDLVGNLGNDTLKTLKSSYERVEKELVKRGEDVVYIKPKPLSTFESEAQRYGEIVDVRLKKIETMTKRIDDILEGLERRGDSRWEYKRHKEETTRTARLSGELGDIQKELVESNISLLGEYAKRMSQMDYWDNNPDMKRMIGEVQEKVAKLERASESLRRMQDKLFDLEQVVPTYIEKIKSNKVKDRFIKQDDLKDVVMRDDKGKLTDVNKELSKTLKLSGIKEREKLIKQLDKWLGQSDVKTPFSGGLNPEIRKVLSRLGEDYDTFMGLNNRQMKDRMRGIVKDLSSEIKRLKYSEFRRYQQKWMAEFTR